MWRSQAPKKHEFTAIKLNSIDAKLSLERSHHHHTRRFLLFHAVLFEFRQSRNLSLCEICSTEVELEQLFNKLAFGQAPGWGKELHRLHISPWVRRPPPVDISGNKHGANCLWSSNFSTPDCGHTLWHRRGLGSGPEVQQSFFLGCSANVWWVSF